MPPARRGVRRGPRAAGGAAVPCGGGGAGRTTPAVCNGCGYASALRRMPYAVGGQQGVLRSGEQGREEDVGLSHADPVDEEAADEREHHVRERVAATGSQWTSSSTIIPYNGPAFAMRALPLQAESPAPPRALALARAERSAPHSCDGMRLQCRRSVWRLDHRRGSRQCWSVHRVEQRKHVLEFV